MPPRETIAAAQTPDGEALTLSVEHGDHVVRVRGEILMSSRVSGSEEAMARLAFGDRSHPDAIRVLVGGLGMGFTLRAVLDAVGPSAQVEVVELLADVVRWNRGPLAHHAGRPLDDPRVTLAIGDLYAHLVRSARTYDAILLDIDNGPEAFTVAANARLYAGAGLAALYGALAEAGVLVLWSAFRSARFEHDLRRAGFVARSVTVRARAAVGKGARHTLFVAERAAIR